MSLKLEINPIACSGHGLCADLAPELIEMDEWGYPMIRERVSGDLSVHAKRAVNACPTLALKLTRSQRHRERN